MRDAENKYRTAKTTSRKEKQRYNMERFKYRTPAINTGRGRRHTKRKQFLPVLYLRQGERDREREREREKERERERERGKERERSNKIIGVRVQTRRSEPKVCVDRIDGQNYSSGTAYFWHLANNNRHRVPSTFGIWQTTTDTGSSAT